MIKESLGQLALYHFHTHLSVRATEAMAAVMGLQSARDLGFSSVILKMDSKAVVQMINEDNDWYAMQLK